MRPKPAMLAVVASIAALAWTAPSLAYSLDTRQTPSACEWNVQLDSRRGPIGWREQAREVLAEASDLTGVRMHIEEVPLPGKKNKDKDALPDEFAKSLNPYITTVRIKWGHSEKSEPSVLNAGMMGLARMHYRDMKILEADIDLNLTYFSDIPNGTQVAPEQVPQSLSGDRVVSAGLLLRHEIGHVLGLAHSASYTSVMTSRPMDYLGSEQYDPASQVELAAAYESCRLD